MPLFNSDPNPKISELRFVQGYSNGYTYAFEKILSDRSLLESINEQKLREEIIQQLIPKLNQLGIEKDVLNQVLRPNLDEQLQRLIKKQDYKINQRLCWLGEGADRNKKGTIIELGDNGWFVVAWDDGKTLAHEDSDLIRVLADAEAVPDA